MLGECGGIAGAFRHPRTEREDSEEPLAGGDRFARLPANARNQTGTQRRLSSPASPEPRRGEFVLGRRWRDRSRERLNPPFPERIETFATSEGNASSRRDALDHRGKAVAEPIRIAEEQAASVASLCRQNRVADLGREAFGFA